MKSWKHFRDVSERSLRNTRRKLCRWVANRRRNANAWAICKAVRSALSLVLLVITLQIQCWEGGVPFPMELQSTPLAKVKICQSSREGMQQLSESNNLPLFNHLVGGKQ